MLKAGLKESDVPKGDLHLVPDIKKTNASWVDKTACSGIGIFDKINTEKGNSTVF